MPTGDFDSKPSWADQVEEEGEDDKCVTSELLKGIPLATGDTSPEPELLPGAPLPPPKEVINGNIKTVTEYKIDEDGKKFKIVRTFRIETRKASKAVARRKNWKKFGNSEFDPPGPNVATTTVSDDVSMTFITSKEDLNCQEEEDPMNKLKGQKIVSCRICRRPLDHPLPLQGHAGAHAEGAGRTAGPVHWREGEAPRRCQDLGIRLAGLVVGGRSGSGAQELRASLGVAGPHLGSGQDHRRWWLLPPTQQQGCGHSPRWSVGETAGGRSAGDTTRLLPLGFVRASSEHGCRRKDGVVREKAVLSVCLS
uniref:Eukaryotic translation initiation factor 3 subunit G n=1 Tax=Bos mutus grunniens TaxID=30521 RepID=A0A8B9WCF3_BOSMU